MTIKYGFIIEFIFANILQYARSTWYKKLLLILILVLAAGARISNAQESNTEVTERRITVKEFISKMKAGWIGQMVGVGWGAPTEFRFQGEIIPKDEVPEWKPEMVNVFAQDDLYVEMTFMRTLEQYGFGVSINQAGIDFANSEYMLWVANRVGRQNLRDGIASPNSGHPQYNDCADAIDYQIEADYSGLIAPGLPNTAVELGEKFGRLMNYGDGLYGGQFVGAMYAEAFFESDPAKIVESGLLAIPAGSQYAEAVRDVIKLHSENPGDWEATWELINEKYHKNPAYRQFTAPGNGGDEFNIDAKINGAYIVMGLLYGNGDPDQTTIISMRCGQDSDCNPSNAAGILFTTMGYENIPERFISAIDNETKFSFTEYSFPGLIDVSLKLAIQAVERAGGRIERNEDSEEVMVIPVQTTKHSKLEQSWEPGPLSENSFSKEELAQIDGHWIYNYLLLILLVLAIVVFIENRNLKTALILIPLIIIFTILELIKTMISADMLSTIDMIVAFESLAIGFAIILLLSDKLFPKVWFLSFSACLVLLAIVGISGALSVDDGRYIALTKTTFFLYGLQAVVWLLAIAFTLMLSRKKYSRVRFNLFAMLGFIVFNILCIYLSAFIMTSNAPMAGIADNFVFVFFSSLSLGIILYLLTLPYLILTYYNSEYNRRFMSWIGNS